MPHTRNFAIRLRALSGLVLFVFVLTHLLNHACGILGLDWMERGRLIFLGVWRNPAGTVVLVTALLTHVVLGWAKVLRLPSWRMPGWELGQITLGLLIPIQLLPHLTGTLIANLVFGIDDTYAFILLAVSSHMTTFQVLLLLFAWAHGCLGIHFWLRFRRGYALAAPWLLGIAAILPVLALVGIWLGTREVLALAADPAWMAEHAAAGHWPPPTEFAAFARMLDTIAFSAAGLTLALLAARSIYLLLRGRGHGTVRVIYSNGVNVNVPIGGTVLQASRSGGIPHASVCGGRGRCSTCRVRVDIGLELLPPPNADELQVLARVGAPPRVRLACQIRPTQDLFVTPLCPPYFEPGRVFAQGAHGHGREMEVTILFSDLRGFTRLTEQKLAYDVVFLLNLYFRAMGEIIEAQQGHLVQVFGDGMMALFGIGEDAETGARRALLAVKAMVERLDALNRERSIELNEPLRMGIGVHSGTAIVGQMGYRDATILTAVGEAVNTAARLEEATKRFGCQLVVSARVGEKAQVNLSPFPLHELEVRGTSRSIAVHAVRDVRDLPALPPAAMRPGGPAARVSGGATTA
jgi:adenylate cyclase